MIKGMYKCITILTGAGISAESGIPTFRDNSGLWKNHRVEEVATPEAFLSNPSLVQKFYNDRRKHILNPSVKPNAAHLALARLQREYKFGKINLVTQNVDNLHERAGCAQVCHMHGELLKVRCTKTGKIFNWTRDVDIETDKCGCCNRLGTIRPHIVWFNEMPLYMDEIDQWLRQTDLFVSIGTSGNVYPASGFVTDARSYGAKTIELNLDPNSGSSNFSESFYGKASQIVPEWVDSILGR